jgi:uncharacterized membrane protein YgdD (TMEM256/DUF423 family)
MPKIITFQALDILMKIASRILFVIACLIAASSVLLAAYVAHMGEGLSPSALKSVQSALQMLQIHVLAMLGVCAVALLHKASKVLLLSAALFLLGLLMFSLNICLIHLGGITVFRSLTPYGGMAFMAAWLSLAVWALRAPRPQ